MGACLVWPLAAARGDSRGLGGVRPHGVRHRCPARRAVDHVPTLILHTAGDRVCHVENARFLARTIPNARYVELPGADHVPWFDPDQTIAEIREFLTGTREAARPDRMLATVLFTDLVGSTA